LLEGSEGFGMEFLRQNQHSHRTTSAHIQGLNQLRI
jgi:hypothetical protein